jgi:predicted glycoside hydrolase/deacetylase ChbG (UPF0249 family)
MGPRLIINADDLGYDPEVSRGILEAMDRGIVSSATLMVNTPHSAAAAAVVEGSGRAIGLHFNLARWRPVSADFPAAELDEAKVAQVPVEAVARELEAQLQEFETMVGAPATHVDVHKHLHRHANVLEGVLKVVAKRALPLRAIDAAMRESVRRSGVRTTDGFIGDAGAEPYWTAERLREALKSLGDGVTELMCHPGYAPSQVKSGYSRQRETELQTLTSHDARRLLEERAILLATFRGL